MNGIGDPNIKYYQKFSIAIGIIIFGVFSAFWFFNSIEDEVILLIILFFALIVFLYSRIYVIKYDDNYFYISNIYREIKVPVDEFEKVIEVIYLPLIYKINFKSSSYLFMINSSTVYKKFFSFGGKNTDDKLTDEIKKNLNI